MTPAYRLIGYALRAEQYCSPSAREYPGLRWGAVWPTVEGAEKAIARIVACERRRFEEGLSATAPSPARLKSAWDDEGGAACLVEYRIADWTIDWQRDHQPGSSALSRATVRCELEQRVAWRPVRSVTRSTVKGGLEVVHEVGDPGEWTDWHRPFGGPGYYGPSIPSIDISVVPHTLTVHASKREIAAWARGAEEVRP